MQHPGLVDKVAEVFLAETGGDMTAFPTAGHLASWAGVCPGANESAGRVKSTKTRDGNRNLKGALGIAALSTTRSRDTYFAAKYRRICARQGSDESPCRRGASDGRRRARDAHQR